MNYTVEHKQGESLTYEEVINDERVQYLLGETNLETSAIIAIQLYYLLPEVDNIMCSIDSSNVNTHLDSFKMHSKRLIVQKRMYKAGDKLERTFVGYKDRIKDMFNECISEEELTYQKIFPNEKLGIPIILYFSIYG